MRKPSFSRVSYRHASWVLASFTWSTGSSNIIQISFNVIEILWMDTSWCIFINWTYIAVKLLAYLFVTLRQWPTQSPPQIIRSHLVRLHAVHAQSHQWFPIPPQVKLQLDNPPTSPPQKKGGHCLYVLKKRIPSEKCLFFCCGDAETCVCLTIIYTFFYRTWCCNMKWTIHYFLLQLLFSTGQKNRNKKLAR